MGVAADNSKCAWQRECVSLSLSLSLSLDDE